MPNFTKMAANLFDPNTSISSVQSIFSSTKCYDLMQNSSKAIIFESAILFQLAFYALIEHDTNVAPVWDPEKRGFVGLMTISDYIHALRVCLTQGIPIQELGNQSINQMMTSLYMKFQHSEFDHLDPEDSLHHLCRKLHRTDAKHVPIVDSESGSLVSILGYLDIVHFLDAAAKQQPAWFNLSIEQMKVGNFTNVIRALRTNTIHEVMEILDANNINSLPVVDQHNRVCGYYHRTDVTFITRASDQEALLTNLRCMSVGEALDLRAHLQQTGEGLTTSQHLVTCYLQDRLSTVLNAMMVGRVTKVVCIDMSQACLGVISVKDLLAFYFKEF